jgi:RNA methyltransferase, TrmH family
LKTIAPDLRSALDAVARCATQRGRSESGRCVVEGERLVVRALRAGLKLDRLLLWEPGRGEPELQRLSELSAVSGVNPLWCPERLLLDAAEGRQSGRVTALFHLPASLALANLAGGVATASRAMIVALVDVREPGNLGALARTALASGALGLWCVGAADAFHPKAIRTSLGGVFRLPIAHDQTTPDQVFDVFAAGLDWLHRAGFTSVAACSSDGVRLPEVRLPPGPIVLVLGNEGSGLSEPMANGCQLRVTIPQSPLVDSFSVSVAAGILLYALGQAS